MSSKRLITSRSSSLSNGHGILGYNVRAKRCRLADRRGRQIGETTKERWAEAEIHRMRGTLLMSMHEYAAAENNYHRALAVARQQQANF
jgi:hypothetical protein